VALQLGQLIAAKSDKEVYPSLSILQGETLLFQQRPFENWDKKRYGQDARYL
jgi:hypothetical protein